MRSLTNSHSRATVNLPGGMTIIKVEKREDPFARIDNRTLQDKRLSWKATGLLAYLLSLPPDWHITLQHLCNAKSDGLHATQSALKELERHAHAKFERPRDRRGLFTGSVWRIFERPFTDKQVFPLSENPIPGKTRLSGKSDSQKNPIPGKIRFSGKSATTNDTDNTNKTQSTKEVSGNAMASSSLAPRVEQSSSFFLEKSESLSPVENKLRKVFYKWCDSVGGKPTEKGFQTWKRSQAEKDKGYMLNGKFFTSKKANELALKDNSLLDKFKPAVRHGGTIELIAARKNQAPQ
jgi:hypothetical protein